VELWRTAFEVTTKKHVGQFCPGGHSFSQPMQQAAFDQLESWLRPETPVPVTAPTDAPVPGAGGCQPVQRFDAGVLSAVQGGP
jgi:hypothetical protein